MTATRTKRACAECEATTTVPNVIPVWTAAGDFAKLIRCAKCVRRLFGGRRS